MNEHESEFDHHAHPVGPENDDSVNPTDTNPQDNWPEPQPAASEAAGESADAGSDDRPRSTAGREMLIQLQQMIDTVALQAGPVIREVGAKAAELAAVAAEKAGPYAHKAADVTESLSERIAARSKEVAADLRRPREDDAEEASAEPAPSEVNSDPGEPDTPASGPRE